MGERAGGSDEMIVTPRDALWIEWQEYLARTVCAVFQVSPSDLGGLESMNRAVCEPRRQRDTDTRPLPRAGGFVRFRSLAFKAPDAL